MDFKDIKQYVSMDMLVDRYGITLNKGKRCACPLHQGDNPTAFSVSNCGQFWTCHTGCGNGDIFQFVEKYESVDTATAKKRIMEMFALDEPEQPKRQKPKQKSRKAISREQYIYRKKTGEEVFRVKRVDYDDGRKDCFQECNGSNKLPTEVRCLYNLHLMAKEPEAYVYLCEGEKTADAIVEAGAIATTNPLGSKNWSDKYAADLSGRKVVVMPDADEHGEQWRDSVLKSLSGLADTVQVVNIPDDFVSSNPQFTGHDFADYVKIHGKDKASDDLVEWTDTSEVMPSGISTKILGRPVDGFRELRRKASLGISSDVFNLNGWIPSYDILVNKGDLIVLMSNTSAGKTRLLHNMPFFISHVNYAIFDLELSLETLFERYGAYQNKMSVRRFKKAMMDGITLEEPRVDNVYLQKIKKLTVQKMRDRVDELEIITGRRIHCVGVDYIGLMSGVGSKYESTSDNVEEFKSWMSDSGRVGILTTQVSRPPDKVDGMFECPSPFDAKNSGSIECSAQEMIGFWKDKEDKTRLWSRFLKYTHGEYPTHDIPLVADNLIITEHNRRVPKEQGLV